MRRGIVGAVLVALVATACGAGSSAGPPRLVKDFAQAARDAGTLAMAGESRSTFSGVCGPEDDRSVELKGTFEGRLDIERLRGTFVMDFGDYRGFGSCEGNDPADDPGFPTRQEGVFFKDRAYIKIEEESREFYREQGVPDSAKWIRYRSDEAFSAEGFDLFSPFPDPGAYFDLLQKIARDIRVVGRERVRGVDTTKHEFDLDLRRAAKRAENKQHRRMYRGMAESIGNILTMEVWASDDSLVYRNRWEITSEGYSMSSSTEFFDYGEPVDVREPPEDEVHDQPRGGTSETFSCTGQSDGSTDC